MAASVQSLRAELHEQQRLRSIMSPLYQDTYQYRLIAGGSDQEGTYQWTSDGGWWVPQKGSGMLTTMFGDQAGSADATAEEYAQTWDKVLAMAENLVAQYLALCGLQHISEWRLAAPGVTGYVSGFDTQGFAHGTQIPFGLTPQQASQAYYFQAGTGRRLYPAGRKPGDPITSELMRIESPDWAIVIYFDFGADGLPIYRSFIISKGDGLMEFLMIASFVFTPFLGGAFAGMIGEAIVGPATAAAYPVLTKSIGQVIINSVMSGGDVVGAVKGVALGYAGTAAGGAVSGQISSAFDNAQWANSLGNAAGDLTRIAIKGGDPTTGLVNLAIKSGGSLMDWLSDDYTTGGVDQGYIPFDETESGSPTYAQDHYVDMGGGNYYDEANDIWYNPDGSYSTWDANDRETVHYSDYDYIDNGDGTYTEAWKDGSFSTVDANGNVLETMDANGNVYQGEGPAPATGGGTGTSAGTRQNVPSGPGVVTASNGVNWSQAAAAIVAGVVAWQKAGGLNPILGNSQRVGSSVVTPNPNGTITTRYANGQTVVSKMPVGQPYVMPDGSTVVNNGDGTITTVRANGTTSRSAIPNVSGAAGGGIGGMSTQTLMIVGAGVAALLLLGGKKSSKAKG